MMFKHQLLGLLILINFTFIQIGYTQPDSLDIKVRGFLSANKYNWQDMNVPEEDGRVLYDIIIESGYKSALEIGTSTGRSGIWIAWALSKTGGKLITIEIDEERFQIAKRNFRNAGLSEYVDQRLGDAHEIVPELEGPFDFVFIDADKTGYTGYLKNLIPKLKPGGCFTAHNVSNTYITGIDEFLEYLQQMDSLKTSIDHSSSSGISVSYKKK